MNCVDSHPNALKFVSSSYDKMIKVWDLEKEDYISGFKAHDGFVISLMVFRLMNRELLLSSGGDGKLKVWETGGESCDML